MKRLILLLILLSFAVWAGVSIAQDPGYMLVAYHHWTLETPLWLGIILWLVLLAALTFLMQVWNGVGSIGAKWHALRARKRLTRSNNLTIRALLETIEGYFDSGEKNFAKAFHNAELPLVNLLGAAFCAERRLKPELRDNYLKKALETSPEAATAIRLIKINWLIAANKNHEAVHEIERILQEDPYQKQALLLAQSHYQRVGLWDKVLKISAILRKRKLIDQSSLEKCQLHTYSALLHDASHGTLADLQHQWLVTPAAFQKNPALVLIYTKALIKTNGGNKAIDLIADSLKVHWDSELVYWYGQAVADNSEQQLKQAEKWLTQHELDPQLLLTLGHLCLRAKLIGKARGYLEASIHGKATPGAYQALGQLALDQGDYEKAAGFFQQALIVKA